MDVGLEQHAKCPTIRAPILIVSRGLLDSWGKTSRLTFQAWFGAKMVPVKRDETK